MNAPEPAKKIEEPKDQRFSPPAVSLPKGGGAIRGIGEKFAANPVTGTGSASVPIATSPGRSGFGPQLSLSYDSGAGNGPFGFGWSLSLPEITRKTNKGLPLYHDAEESDVFILSGAEDLVPLLNPDGSRFRDTISAPGYTIHRYRPRIEGLFARIERWTRKRDGDVHWRSISKDNILTLYGKDSNARITDPLDSLRVFTWLICETRDDKGNAVLYDYKREDGAGVDLTLARERNRGDRHDPRRTANRYLKRIRYGNRVPLLENLGRRPSVLTDAQIQSAGWMFEVVFDYEDHDPAIPMPRDDEARDAAGVLKRPWKYRQDPFSTYRSGFEVRTTRLCQRVLMFHHFPDEVGVGNDCLVRSTDFTYSYEQDPANARNPVYTFLLSVTQSGYRRHNGGYLKRSLPPVEYEYTQPIVQDTVQDVDATSLENLPIGLDGAAYEWTDLHGEGIPGILTEQAGGWFYKRNVSPISERPVEFAPLERVAVKPNLALAGGQAQFMDLAGDGLPDLVVLDGPIPGLYEHDEEEGWQSFRPFTSRPGRDTRDPNLKFIDLDGDGHADVLISEDDAFVWHASLAEQGFGPARRVHQVLDEEKGPRLVFADGTQSIYLADLSGDGLTDLVRIRNGEVCYWPNLGYGRFGAKVTMDQAPRFDHPDQFDHKRIRLADIDGSGTTDIIYLHRDGVRLYFNQSGNSWSAPQPLRVFPRVDDLIAITPTDLLGNGTACLVWSSPLPGDARRQMRYVDLMGGKKPHLLIKTANNLGAETRVEYTPSTKFYLEDKRDGKPWITRLPFPVHVVERVETFDTISRNRFVTRYAYHHGYFDGDEREFRGFGMVEQWDTEQFTSLAPIGGEGWGEGEATNIDAASHVPPVHTKTWFHTGIFFGRNRISNFFSGLLNATDRGEYYREPPGLDDEQAEALLLDDTVLPGGLSAEEEREACRALKGSMLRREIYALDDTDKEPHPYTVTEQNFTIRRVQPRDGNRHAVFFTHPREAISYHYERNPADPRVTHALTLEVDKFGNVLQSTAVGYGRRQPDMSLSATDRLKQTQILTTYTENRVTNAIDVADGYRTPLPCESRTYEVTGLALPADRQRFTLDKVLDAGTTAAPLAYEQPPTAGSLEKRLIEHVRTLYRRDDLAGPLSLGDLQSLGLPFESYKLALTPGLVAEVYGARVSDAMLEAEGRYVHSEGDANWWIPSGRVFYSLGSGDTAAQELAYACQHFFLPHRYRDPFHTNAVSTESFVTYDSYDLLMVETRDALGNRVTVGANDYRVLQPRLVSDPNRNKTEVAFDTLGMVAGTAVMGKPLPVPVEGDSLNGFVTDLTQAQIDGFHDAADPHATAPVLLQNATTRIVYDLDSFRSTRRANPADPTKWLPPYAATLARETHASDPLPPQGLKIQLSFSYSDGFGREIQKKIQAEPGPVVTGGPVINPRWVGNGWTVFNNKGKPVRQYEPFFSQLPEKRHRFEFGTKVGVSPVLFYDPVERVVATLHPNHTWDKVVFDPWRQTTYDVNDTVMNADGSTDPKSDQDVKGFFSRLPDADYLPTWYEQRIAMAANHPEQVAADKARVHRQTPTVAHLDTLGRTFLTIAHNRFERNGAITDEKYPTRVELDIEGNQRAVRDAVEQNGDALGRVVMRYDYDMLGNRIKQASMEAGARWMLANVTGKPIRAWDDRNFTRRITYDSLQRPRGMFVTEPAGERLAEETIYGEGKPFPEATNHRGKVWQVRDDAGIVTSEAYDFKGNLLSGKRDLRTEYKTPVNWAQQPAPATSETFTSSSSFDALNRPVEITAPDKSVIRPGYNEANLLERVEANLRGAVVATAFVTDIDYDAKGQRVLVDYGNGVRTTYTYDPLTFRLVRLLTRRNVALFPHDCPRPSPPDWPGCQVQNLHYTYDPVGNITHIRDDAQQTRYFLNKRVEPSAEYTYDALYRLIEATGREHLGQAGAAPTPSSYNDKPRVGILLSASDGHAMGRYLERYVYDAVGNFQEMRHIGSDPVSPGWTRAYAYNEPSLLEPGKQNNRLTSTTIGATTETYSTGGNGYDAHGNMLRMPQLQIMQWDFKDQLQVTRRQAVNAADAEGAQHQGERTWYVYDARGQRVRKVTELAAGQVKDERIYLGGFEIYRRQGVNPFVRETLHIMDDKQRVALVETRTQGIEPGVPEQLIRYQFGNHLGSSSLELDDQAQIISYEEYTPYGSPSYQAVRSQTETAKRYRYTGKERDEESGLYYHGARYYAAWLGRWVACDPAAPRSGLNLYLYVSNNPIRLVDPDGAEEKHWGPVGLLVGYAEGNLKAAKELLIGQAQAAEILAKPLPEKPTLQTTEHRPEVAAQQAEEIKENLTEKAKVIAGGVAAPVVLAAQAGEHLADAARAAKAGKWQEAGQNLGQANLKTGVAVFSAIEMVKGSVGMLPGRAPRGLAPVESARPLPATPEALQARAVELKTQVAQGPASRRSVVAVQPATAPNGDPVLLTAGAGEARGKLGRAVRPGEIVVEVPKGGHAEIALQQFAEEKGYKPTGPIYPSDPFCPNCAAQTRAAGLTPPDAKVSEGPGKPAVDLEGLTNQDLGNMAADQNPRYKTHDKIPNAGRR